MRAHHLLPSLVHNEAKTPSEVPLAFSAPSLYLALPSWDFQALSLRPSGGQSCCVMLQSPLHMAPKSKLSGRHRHAYQEGHKGLQVTQGKDHTPPWVKFEYTAACSEHSESSFCLCNRALLAMGLGLGHRLR